MNSEKVLGHTENIKKVRRNVLLLIPIGMGQHGTALKQAQPVQSNTRGEVAG